MCDLILGRAEAPFSHGWVLFLSILGVVIHPKSLISKIDKEREKSAGEQLPYTICVAQWLKCVSDWLAQCGRSYYGQSLLIRISVSPDVTTSISQLNLEEIVEGYSHGIYETGPLYLYRKWLFFFCKSSGRTWHTIFSTVWLLALGPWQALEGGIQGIFVFYCHGLVVT